MDSGEEITKPGSSLLESMLTYDSSGQLPRATPITPTSTQASGVVPGKIWRNQQGIATEDSHSGASNVTVRLPIHTVSTSFGVLGSGSLNLKRTVVGRPVKTDLSGSTAGRVLAQRKNPSVKLKHLTSGATSHVFSATVKGFKKVMEEVGTQSPTRETDSTGSSKLQQQQQDSSVDLSEQQVQGGGGNGGASGPSSIGADNDLELIEETWPGKVCSFCNLGERSQLGQGEMLRLEVGPDFESQRQSTLQSEERLQSLAANAGAGSNKNNSNSGPTGSSLSSVNGSQQQQLVQQQLQQQQQQLQQQQQHQQQQPSLKKPRLTLKGRRTSSFDALQTCSELQEELNAVGYAEEPDLLAIVEPCGYFYAHRMCATWSKGVTVTNCSDGLSVVSSSPQVAGADTALIRAASLRCHSCGSFGASLSCQQINGGGIGCLKSFHFPCAVSCGVSCNFLLYFASLK